MALMLQRKERPVRVMPSGTPVVDWDNPLARDLRFLLYPAGPTFIDLVNNKMGVVGAGCTQGGSLAGRGVSMGHLGTGPSYVDALPQVAFGTGDFSIAGYGTFLSPASAAVVWLSNDANQAVGNSQWRLQPNFNGSATSAGAFAFLTVGSGATTAVGANSLWADGEAACFVGTRAGTALALWKNGVSVATNTGTLRDVSAAENQRIGCGWGTSTNNAGGVRVLGAGWARKLTDDEIRAFSDNPFGLLSRRVRTYFLPAAAGGGVTVDPTSGTVNFSGETPTLTIPLSITLTDGAISFAGGTPTITISVTLDPTSGTISFVGETPTLTIPISITPTSGVVAFTGETPTINTGGGVTADPTSGAITFTGETPTLTIPLSIDPTSGVITFSGDAPTLTGVSVAETTVVITEVTGTPGFDVEVIFTGVADPLGVVATGYYAGNAAHAVYLEAWNYTDGRWDRYLRMDSISAKQRYSFLYEDAAKYVSGGEAKIRFYHASSGTPGHTLNLDRCVVLEADLQ